MAVDVALTAPAPRLLAGTHGMVLTAPNPTLIAAATAGSGAVARGTVPVPSLSAHILAGEILGVTALLPAPTLLASATGQVLLSVSSALPIPRLTANILSGNVASAALTAPAPTFVALGWENGDLVVALVAPAPRLSASMGAAVSAAYRTWVLNTRKLALTEYGDEFAFNSYAQFQGVTLACGPSGVVVLGTQALDGTEEIVARVRTGQESFESSFHKRVPRIYVSGEFPGDMLFRTIVENGTRTYSLPANGITRLQQRRVPVGKGPKSRFHQYEIENVAGADFSLNDMLVYPIVLRRRVQ